MAYIFLSLPVRKRKPIMYIHSNHSCPNFFWGGGLGSSPKSLHPSENSPWRKAYPATPQGRPAGVPWNPRVPAPAPPGPPLRSHRSPRDPTPVSGGFFEGSRAQGDGQKMGCFTMGPWVITAVSLSPWLCLWRSWWRYLLTIAHPYAGYCSIIFRQSLNAKYKSVYSQCQAGYILHWDTGNQFQTRVSLKASPAVWGYAPFSDTLKTKNGWFFNNPVVSPRDPATKTLV